MQRHALTVEDCVFSHKIDNVTVFSNSLNHKGHQNRIHGSRVKGILLNAWILPLCGATAVEGLKSRGYPV